MKEPLIQIVDENDQPTGRATIEEAYRKELIHRVVYTILEDPDGHILLQKRSPEVINYPNCWDIASAGHVDFAENYEIAAKRELYEELGVTKIPRLQEIDYFRSDEEHPGHILHRFNKIYKGVIPVETSFKLQAAEVTSVEWFKIEEVKNMITDYPSQVASGLVLCIGHYY